MRKKKRQGFMLIEALAALTIFSVSFVAIHSLNTRSVLLLLRTEHVSLSLDLLQSELDRIVGSADFLSRKFESSVTNGITIESSVKVLGESSKMLRYSARAYISTHNGSKKLLRELIAIRLPPRGTR